MGHGWQLDLVLPGESLEAGWHIEEVLVVVSSNEDAGNLLHEVAFDQLHHDTHLIKDLYYTTP